jgi:hypothetical protein
MGLFALLAVVAVLTLKDQKVLGVTLLLLGLFAVRTWMHQRRQNIEDNADRERQLERVKLGRS